MGGCVIGVEIGGTKLQAALGDGLGAIHRLERSSVNRGKGAPGILEWMEAAVGALINGASSRPVSAGIGFGGPVDSATGRVLVSHQIQGWEGIELRTWFEQRFGMPVVVENDANAAGWAEYKLGAGKGTKNFVYMNMGSGIGGALIVNGELYNGQGYGAGEIGHVWVPDWTGRSQNGYDKLENLCSGWSIERRIRETLSPVPGTPLHVLCQGNPAELTCMMLAEAARMGDALALGEIGQVARTTGLAIANLITLFHPEKIALGGGVSLMGDVLISPLKEQVDRLCFGPYKGRYELVPCELEENVVVVGALLLSQKKQINNNNQQH